MSEDEPDEDDRIHAVEADPVQAEFHRARVENEVLEYYRALRLEDGLPEPLALAALERNVHVAEEEREIVDEILRARGLLDEWPVGWREEEAATLADGMTFEDVLYFVSRIVDAPREELLINTLLAAQGYMAPVLRAIGPAWHLIAENPRYSAGKTRCAQAFTFLAGGPWLDSATVAFLKAARREGPCVVGVDEGDEAERDAPGVKAYLLATHNWDATYGKFSEPDAKGKRAPEEVEYGGPVFITFRKKPWPAILSRSHVSKMEPSSKAAVSDDGAGDGMRRLLLPARTWLRGRCEEELRGWDATRALLRTGQPDFRRKLDRVAGDVALLRQRDKARTLLFIAECLDLDLEREIRDTIAAEEVESENATIIEAVESDPLYQAAVESKEWLSVEDLRLNVQKKLREAREWVDVSRNRFASVLDEMDYSKKRGPTWKRVERDGREFMAIFPAGLRSARGAPPKDKENPQTPQTPQTPEPEAPP